MSRTLSRWVSAGLSRQQEAPISSNEFRTLNLCLDDAIAEAVTAYAKQRDRDISERGTERLGILAHEQRNLLNTAMLSFECIKEGVRRTRRKHGPCS